MFLGLEPIRVNSIGRCLGFNLNRMQCDEVTKVSSHVYESALVLGVTSPDAHELEVALKHYSGMNSPEVTHHADYWRYSRRVYVPRGVEKRV